MPILSYEIRWNTAEKPSMRFSNSGSSASGVTSRPVKPVPPVVITTSTPGSRSHASTRSRIAGISSGTMDRAARLCPASVRRWVRVSPERSSSGRRVSETVRTAMFRGMKRRASV